ncbi:MAG: metal ABC transporter permease [Gammaproteobacteria bacterium]|nr:metal ABC transporter permease [Gammaproteobacteria bacterium]
MDDFIINALLAGVGLALLAGSLGCVVVWRRMAYFGDTLAHSALLGVALAVSVEMLPIFGVAVIGVALASLLFLMEQRQELSTDTLLGIMAHSALALGVVVLSIAQRQGSNVDFMAYLFGDILAVSREELVWIYAGAVLVLSLFAYLWRDLLSISVHEELARTDGVSVTRTRFIFMLLLALTVAVAIKVVGALLITALLIIPAASARLYSSTPLQMVVLSVLFAVLSVVLGLASSMQWDMPTAPAIVLAAAALFFLSNLVRTHHS